jgi:hypothetical protein
MVRLKPLAFSGKSSLNNLNIWRLVAKVGIFFASWDIYSGFFSYFHLLVEGLVPFDPTFYAVWLFIRNDARSTL